MESAPKSSSKTYDLKDDSNEELSDIVSLQSITFTNDSSKLNKTEPFSSTIEESRVLSSFLTKSNKSDDFGYNNLNELNSKDQNFQKILVNKNLRNDKCELLKVTVENLTESSEDELDQFKRPARRKNNIPM